MLGPFELDDDCRLRKQSLFPYLTQALAAHSRGDPVPALA